MMDIQIAAISGRPAETAIASRLSQVRKARASGFTLVEVLVSMIIFGIISLSLAMALSSALRAQATLQVHQDQAGAVRAVFDRITRDIEAAYGSQNNVNAVFIAGGSGSNGFAGGASGLLTFSGLFHRIQADDLIYAAASNSGQQSSATSSAQSGAQAVQQSDFGLVRYDLDQQAGTLKRTVIAVPSDQAIQTPPVNNSQQTGGTIIATHVISVTIRCWDGVQQTWRTDWDYEQQTIANAAAQSSTSGTTGTTGTSGSTSTSGSSSTTPALPTATASASTTSSTSVTTNTTSGDIVLPLAVEVTIVLRAADGSPLTYVTEIPLLAPLPQDSGIGTAAPTAPMSAITNTTGS
jgi:prepilin-type N-terminal cleavage/methylation domain-containing protein